MKAYNLLMGFFGMCIQILRNVNVPGFPFSFLDLAGAQIGLVVAVYFIKLTLGFGGGGRRGNDD